MSAPVCPVSRDQALPGMPGRYLPVPPKALDLPSLIAATNALRDLALSVFGPGVPANNMPYSAPSSTGSLKKDSGVAVQPNWREIKRDDEDVRVYMQGNKKVYIDVLRINNLVFHWEHNAVAIPQDQFEWAYGDSIINWKYIFKDEPK